jgi:C4-dicarboxylate-binding protein DctP
MQIPGGKNMWSNSNALMRGSLITLAALGLLAGCGEPTSTSSGPSATAADNSARGGEEPIIIKFPHVTAPATPKGQTAQRFKELAEARFPGRVEVQIYPSGQLMTDSDSLEALAFGEIQMIAVSLSLFDRLTHQFQVFDLPFLFPSLDAVERFQNSPDGQKMLTSIADKGILGLTFWHNGMKQFSGPRPLRTPEDARGLKFRIMESDILQSEIEAVGGSPQKMDFGEVYQALQTGTVDAQENTWSNIYSSKFYEVQPYITESNHGYIGYLVAVNPDFWNGLPDDIRTGLKEALDEATEWGNERAASVNREARQKIIESGRSEIITLTPEELAAWREAMRPVWKQFEDVIGADVIAAAQATSETQSSSP